VAASDRFAQDADRNDLLRTEIQQALPKLVPVRGSTDRDGSVSREELTRIWSGKSRARDAADSGFAEHFRRADSDSDGSPSAPSANATAARSRSIGSTAPHGRLTREELTVVRPPARLARARRQADPRQPARAASRVRCLMRAVTPGRDTRGDAERT
jgi:hypothetical protein